MNYLIIGFLSLLVLICIIHIIYSRIKYNPYIEDLEKQKMLLQEIKGCKNRIRDFENQISENKYKLQQLFSFKKKLEDEIKLYEENIELSEFSIYKPVYDFNTSAEFKEHLNLLYETQKEFIKEKKAAVCTTEWKVGGSKRQGTKMTNDSLKLMIRAFNGESDSCIAKVKYNNIDTMFNRIQKSYEKINQLNAVSDCYITKEYLQLKLDELILTHERALKIQEEKEELLLLREQQREEEKAQKEYLLAEKEEKDKQKALQMAELQLHKSQASQEIAELTEKIQLLKIELQKASEKRERAVSMAQITRAGYVYIISNIGSFGENTYKIGSTRRLEPMDRVRELGDASVPFIFDVHAIVYCEDAPSLEKRLHKALEAYRVNKVNLRKEFFNIDLATIESLVSEYHGKIYMNYTSEALHFRESLRLSEKSNQSIELQKQQNIEKQQFDNIMNL